MPSFYAATNGMPFGLDVADFNGDGKLDVVVGNQSDSGIRVLLGHGDGTFNEPVKFDTPNGQPQWVAVGDFNGMGNRILSRLSILKNQLAFSSTKPHQHCNSPLVPTRLLLLGLLGPAIRLSPPSIFPNRTVGGA
jgi:hypothetical protein